MKNINSFLAILFLALFSGNAWGQTNTFPSSGNVGIGTTSPTTKLQIIGPDNNGTIAGLKITSGGQNMLLDGNEIDGDADLYLNRNVSKNVFLVTGGGKVGVGIGAPNAKLHVLGSDNNGTTAAFQITSGTQNMLLDGNEIDTDGTFYLNNNVDNNIIIGTGGGNVGIGTYSPNNKLDINGTARAKEVRVQTGWSDYVFYPDYQLPSLQEEEQHIESNGHLLGFESEAAMKGEVQLGDVTKRQQAKIEEVILHLIKMDKEIQQLKAENSALKQDLKALKTQD